MMKINSITNANVKAIDESGSGMSETTRAQAIAELQLALGQLSEFADENGEFLDADAKYQIDLLQSTGNFILKALTAYGVMGSDSAAGVLGDGASDTDWRYTMPRDIMEGWNNLGENGINTAGFADHRGYIESDASRFGTFAGTVEIEQSNSPLSPNKIAYQMSEGEYDLRVVTWGDDLILTTYDKDHNAIKSYVINGAAVRPEPIAISALGLSHTVNIDLSQAFRISDGSYIGYPYGARSGFYVHGTNVENEDGSGDVIMGSHGCDVIIGYAGNDFLDGGAGNDRIWGDEWYDGATEPADGGGNDIIRGGAGNDKIYGGGGYDTVFESDRGETIKTAGERGFVQDILIDPPDLDLLTSDPDAPNVWFSSSGTGDGHDWVYSRMENGEMIVQNATGIGGVININMPTGFNMAYGERGSDNSLIITFVSGEHVERTLDDGRTVSVPRQFRMRIEGFFDVDHGLTRLNFNGDGSDEIIDFSRIVDLTDQIINVSSGGGKDLILNAQYRLFSDGLDIDDFGNSYGNGEAELNTFAGDIIGEYTDSELGMSSLNNYDVDWTDPDVQAAANTDSTDGLTTAEMEAYKRTLPLSPADTNGDHVLSEEEIEAYEALGESGGFKTEVKNIEGDNQIFVTADPTATEHADTVKIKAPLGYSHEHAYMMWVGANGAPLSDSDPDAVYTDQDLLIVFYKETAEGRAETVVVRVDGDLIDRDNFNVVVGYDPTGVAGDTSDWNGGVTLIEVSRDADDYRVFGGDDADLIFAQSGVRRDVDAADTFKEGEFDLLAYDTASPYYIPGLSSDDEVTPTTPPAGSADEAGETGGAGSGDAAGAAGGSGGAGGTGGATGTPA